MQGKVRKLPSLEDLYDLEDDLLGVPDNRTWKPALARGRRRSDGDRVLVKYWQKSGQAIDGDLRELWHREMRNAERIRVRPDGDEMLVPILEVGEARDAFYLVMSGEWVPLHIKLRHAGAGHWLRNLQVRSNRELLWRNVGRLVRALDVIHAQRIVHGGFGQASIFSASDHEPDFRVGGFEWCLKIGEIAPGPRQEMASSFTGDLYRLGAVVSALLGLSDAPSRTDIVARGETLQLSGNEQALVLGLVNPVSDGHFDRRRLGALLAAVEKDFIVVGWGDSARYVLGVQLGTKALADAVGGETNWLIQSDDRHGQLEFIRADLTLGPEIVRHAIHLSDSSEVNPGSTPNRSNCPRLSVRRLRVNFPLLARERRSALRGVSIGVLVRWHACVTP